MTTTTSLSNGAATTVMFRQMGDSRQMNIQNGANEYYQYNFPPLAVNHNQHQQQKQQQQQQQQIRWKPQQQQPHQQQEQQQTVPIQQQSQLQNKKGQQIHDTSILAPSYVPEHIRRIHFLPVASFIPTKQPVSLSGLSQNIFFSLVAPIPFCACSSGQQQIQQQQIPIQQQQQPQQNHQPPPSQPLPPKQVHFLPWQLIPKLPPMEPHFVYSPAGQQRLSPEFKRIFPSIYDQVLPGGRDAYLRYFESLIREEYEETMTLYERYTQYSQQVTPILQQQDQEPSNLPQQANKDIASNQKMPNNPAATTQAQQTTQDRAILSIQGIADARPPLQSGDIVLLRCILGSGSNAVMEVPASVIRTIRSNGTTRPKDQVVITWLNDLDNPSNNFMAAPAPHSSPPIPTSQINYAVRFLPSVTIPERCLTALKWLSTIHPLIAKNLLFPSEAPVLPEGDDETEDDGNSSGLLVDRTDPTNLMNEQQSRFCRMVIRRTKYPSMENVRPPMILTGPAGTGKTKALLMSILNTLAASKKNRVLVCTPSHTAADVISRRLVNHLPTSDIFRLCDSTRPVETLPVEILPLTRQSADGGDFTLPSPIELLSFRVIVCTCVDAHILYLCGLTNASLRSRRQCLAAFIHQTVAASPGVSMTGTITGTDEPHFTHLFIDEAAQATEPETLIPFSVVVDDAPNVQKVEIALTGDPRQLHPETNSPWAREGLQLSLLERLLRQGGREHMLGPPTKDSWVTMEELIEYSFQSTSSSNNGKNKNKKNNDDNLSVFLTLSYRGHPSFLRVPSKLFYFDKLRSVYNAANMDEKWCHVLRKVEALSNCVDDTNKAMDWPIHFRGVVGKDTSVAVEACWGSNSWANPTEAKAIVEIVQNMVKEGKVQTQSIGIMAAFRAQVVLIRRLLREIHLGAINVGTVEDYQAVERHVILISLTRSNEQFIPMDVQRSAGLYQQPKRMNVALTRAEHMLIVVGNPNTMDNDPYWKEWLHFCLRNGLWYGDNKETAALST